MLSNRLLSYYRSKAEMRQTCRGTINLSTANITVEDSYNFIISNGCASDLPLEGQLGSRASALGDSPRMANAKAVKMLVESSDESGNEESVSQTDKTEYQNTLRTRSSKVENLST